MRKRYRLAGAVFACGRGRLCPAQDYVDQVVERARKEFDVPGIAVAIVKDGKVVLAKGYGVRKLGEPAPVTAQSLFRIASNTKAFTTAALAMLVDEKQDPLGRPRDAAHARLPDVRPLRHARDDDPRPADASQRARAGRGRPDVLSARATWAATKSSSACASSSLPPVFAAPMRTTICCTSWPGS